MTEIDNRPPSPVRRRGAWTEQDFAAAMEAVREDCALEDIAEQIGRSPHGFRNHLRKLLPADERHLRADLVQARLRQLNQNGDYDWLGAMAQQPTPEWKIWEEVHERCLASSIEGARSVGIGVLSDNDLITLARAILDSQGGFPRELRYIVAMLLRERDLVQDLDRWMRARSERALELLMAEADQGPEDEGYWSPQDRYTGEVPPWEI